jgi:hypothetical protein
MVPADAVPSRSTVVSCRVHLTGGGSAGDLGVRFAGAPDKPVHKFRRPVRRPAGLVRFSMIKGYVFTTKRQSADFTGLMITICFGSINYEETLRTTSNV